MSEPLDAPIRPVAVRVRGLSWTPLGSRRPVLDGLDLQIEPGERLLLAGPSGAGKSTLLRALAGVLDVVEPGALAGEVLLDGTPVRPGDGRSGLLLQDPADARVAGTIGRDVAFGPENLGLPRDEIHARVRWALDAVGLAYPPGHASAALSGGEAQRLALAGVLALRPGLLLLDEPTSMLDADSAAQVHDALDSVLARTGATLVVVEHRLEGWLSRVDRLVVLDASGRVVADGPVETVLASHGSALASQGVWVPGAPPPAPVPVPSELVAPYDGHPADPSPYGRGPGVSALVESPGDRSPYEGVAEGSPPREWPHARGAAPTSAETRPALVEARGITVVRKARLGLRVARGAARERGRTVALDGVDAQVSSGELVALRGRSGAGKSTLLGVLAGLDEPDGGQLNVDPEFAGGATTPPYRWSSHHLAARVGWVPQRAELTIVAPTVRESLLATPRALGRPAALAEARVDGLLAVLGLTAAADRNPHQLSGGELRRLAVAAAFAHGPALVALDEPTVGQDRLTWSAVCGLILAARAAGVGVVAGTHDELLADRADACLWLDRGRVVIPPESGDR